MQNSKRSDLNTKKILVSACLLGEYCRYDGKTKQDKTVLELLKEGYEVIPFCPEAPVFGTPRERIDVVIDKDEYKIVTHETKKDVTTPLQKYIKEFYATLPDDLHLAIFKSKSPSCGYQTTPQYDTTGTLLTYGDGIAVKIFKEYFPTVEIKDEVNVVE